MTTGRINQVAIIEPTARGMTRCTIHGLNPEETAIDRASSTHTVPTTLKWTVPGRNPDRVQFIE
jgi:hypothetical protein